MSASPYFFFFCAHYIILSYRICVYSFEWPLRKLLLLSRVGSFLLCRNKYFLAQEFVVFKCEATVNLLGTYACTVTALLRMAVRSLMAQEKNMSASQPHSFLLRSLYHTFLQDLCLFLEFSLTVHSFITVHTYYFHSFQGALPSCHICSSCILSRWVSIHFQKPSWQYTISCPSLASCSNGAFSKTVSSPSI